jgi:periplasmic protein TonB
MTLEDQRVSALSENEFGSLSSCFVEGDPQSEKRARRIKQHAVAISITVQSLALVALILFPLLSKGERISMQVFTPLPPYHRGSPPPANPGSREPNHRITVPCHICPPTRIPTVTPQGNSQTLIGDTSDGIAGIDDPRGDPNGNPFGAEVLNLNRGPARPVEEEQRTVRRKISELQQMAQLVTRVEPIYPRLAVQIHHEGRVELHAIISAEGRIESLEVISGDPLFIQSALSAVREWRYRPTILNGRPIEIDTHITVIYTLSH